MSRTKKGSKRPGFEYWSKRPCSKRQGAVPGRDTKRRTHKLERIEGNSRLGKELKELGSMENRLTSARRTLEGVWVDLTSVIQSLEGSEKK